MDDRLKNRFDAFAQQRDPAPIWMALESVEAARDLPLWLQFFAALDGIIDPAFDPTFIPWQPQPPETKGIVYGTGEVDPETIEDPAVRAEYVRALKASKDYERHYSTQMQLRSIDERALGNFGVFLRDHDVDAASALAAAPLSESRKQRLREAGGIG